MLDKSSIIICNNESKIYILKQIKKLVNIKFMSMSEFIKSYYFDYDEKTILYLIKKYNVKYEIAKEYLENLIYIEDKFYNNKKLDFLVDIKKELISNNLLIFNNKFKSYVKDKNIIIYNYELNRFEKHLLKNINYQVVNKPDNNYKPKIYEFDTIEEEVEFVAIEISKLINSVGIDKIKLLNVSDDYIDTIEHVFNLYNLKINKHRNISIISNVVGKTFFENIDSGVDSAIKKIEKYSDTDTYNKIVDICNKYVWCTDLNDLKLLIQEELNNTYIKNDKYTNEIEVVDYKTYNFSDEYAFMLGFNQGIIPKLKRDEDYISDSIKPEYLDTTVELNKLEKEVTIKSIKNIKNLIITYKLKTSFNTFYPSSLIEELDVTPKKAELDLSESFSEINDSLKLSKYLDNLIKYGEKSKELSILNSNYNIPYNTYSNNFTGIDKAKIIDYIKSLNTFNLSYSSMDNYNRCAFRFYVEKILCLKSNPNKFSVFLGNLYHHILELSITKNINIEDEVYKYIKDNELVLKRDEEFFIKRAITNIEYLISAIKVQNTYSKLDTVETEKCIKIPIKDNINFIGFIDKIMYKKYNNEIILSIIDYKTYVKKPSLKYASSGIGLQLPAYMYLAKNEFKHVKFIGFYMQNILLDNKSDEEKFDSLKLIGYTNTDKEILEQFDYNYMDSKVIKGIKVNNDGSFSSNSLKNMLDDKGFDSLIDLTKNKINDTLNNIMSAKFDINPKYDKTNIGCEFCNFKDICFMNESNLVKIKSDEAIENDMDI